MREGLADKALDLHRQHHRLRVVAVQLHAVLRGGLDPRRHRPVAVRVEVNLGGPAARRDDACDARVGHGQARKVRELAVPLLLALQPQPAHHDDHMRRAVAVPQVHKPKAVVAVGQVLLSHEAGLRVGVHDAQHASLASRHMPVTVKQVALGTDANSGALQLQLLPVLLGEPDAVAVVPAIRLLVQSVHG